MSGQLNAQGVVAFFSDSVGTRLTAMNMGWPAVFGLLNVVYFGLHYMFASQTAHVGALYAAFLAMMVASGAPFPPAFFPPCLLLTTSLAKYGSLRTSQQVCIRRLYDRECQELGTNLPIEEAHWVGLEADSSCFVVHCFVPFSLTLRYTALYQVYRGRLQH